MMKERYRNMMEQVVLSEEAKANLLEKLEGKNSARKGSRVLRTTLVAACACLVLVGGAFAVETIMDRGFVEIFDGKVAPPAPFAEVGEMKSGAEVTFRNVSKFDFAAFPAEIQNLAEQGTDPEGIWWTEFGTWAGAEAALGVDLIDNAVLSGMDQYEERLLQIINAELDTVELGRSHCYGAVMFDSKNQPKGIRVSAHYTSEQWPLVLIDVMAQLYTETEGETTITVWGVSDLSEFSVEEYAAKNGALFNIINHEEGDDYEVVFAANGIVYRVIAYPQKGESEEALAALKTILDSFG